MANSLRGWSNPVIPKPALVTGLLLAVAILSFAGLRYQTVPMSTTQTITQESTETLVSYSPYMAPRTLTYANLIWPTATATLCENNGAGPCALITYPASYWVSVTLPSTYEMQTTALIAYSQTLTSSSTESSTSMMPAYAALGLTNGSFIALAVIVTVILALLTAWVTFVVLSQFVNAPYSRMWCRMCGAKLPPASKFCDKCGTKQS
jgi:hypothetical protein